MPKRDVMDIYLNVQKKLKVTNESLIRYKGKAFSVDPQYINCLVDIEDKNNKLYIYYQGNLLEIFDLAKYNQKINYKTEHYTKALAQTVGTNIKYADIEKKAIENLKNLDKLGGIINDLQ